MSFIEFNSIKTIIKKKDYVRNILNMIVNSIGFNTEIKQQKKEYYDFLRCLISLHPNHSNLIFENKIENFKIVKNELNKKALELQYLENNIWYPISWIKCCHK